MNKKGLKTTIVAVLIGILSVATFVLWFTKKLDNSQLTLGLASIATFGTTIGLWLAKDSDKSHSKIMTVGYGTEIDNGGGHPDPDKEEK